MVMSVLGCPAGRRGFTFCSLVAQSLGPSCSLSPTSARGPSTGVCSWGCPRTQESTLVRKECGDIGSWGCWSPSGDKETMAWESWPQPGPFLVPWEEGPVPGVRGYKWPHPSHITQQWLLSSVFPSQAFQVMGFLTPVPSDCLPATN